MKPLLILVGLLLCGTVSVSAIDRAREQDDVFEAVFQHLINQWNGGRVPMSAYFISINGKDLTDAFMARFAKQKPPVKKYSEAEIGPGGQIIDKTTKKPGIYFQIESIKWLGDDKVEVSGGYYIGNLGASWNTYEVTRTAKGWKVTKDIQGMVSSNDGA